MCARVCVQEQHINERYGFDEFSMNFPVYALLALYFVFSGIAFVLFCVTDYSTMRLVDTEYGNAPMLRCLYPKR